MNEGKSLEQMACSLFSAMTGTSTDTRIVAHIDILGMSTLVESNFPEAWGMLSDLVSVRDHAQAHEYEFVETREHLRVFERIKIVTFSDTLLLFTAGNSDLELKSMIILVTQIFHKALFRCVPVRAGLSAGEFWFNFEKSMYAGPALIEAYRAGEAAQWLGIAFAESIQEAAIGLGMKSADRDVVVRWPIPVKNGERSGTVVNWPAIFAHDLKAKPPISVSQFYAAFEPSFGSFDDLPRLVQLKYENTVQFMNDQLKVGHEV